MSNQNGAWGSRLARIFAIDPRSLALFRIGIACLLLVDLAIRAQDLQSMYSDDGMFSRAEICRRYGTIWNWSFHFATGSVTGQAYLFGLAAFLAVALLIGWQTRFATVGSWLMLISIHHRVPPILSGADILFRMLLFWAMFLPLGRAWSIDAMFESKRDGKATTYEPIFSVASAAILLQMAMMYLFSAIFKTNSNWLHGEAVAGSLKHAFFASPAAGFMLSSPFLLKLMTWGTLLLEWTAPVLLFVRLRTPWLRIAVLTALAAMHIGIWIFLEVDLFSAVCITGLMLFIPTNFWQRFSSKTATSTPRVISAQSLGTKLSNVICGIALAYVLAVNINTLRSHPLNWIGVDNWKPFFVGSGFGQKWGMFETAPSNNGWYVAKATLNDGSEVDLLRNGAPLDWNKPKFPAGIYPTFRWRKLFREMTYFDEQGYQVFRAPAAYYLCRNWNATHPKNQQVAAFELVFCHEGEASADLLRPAVTHEQFLEFDFSGT